MELTLSADVLAALVVNLPIAFAAARLGLVDKTGAFSGFLVGAAIFYATGIYGFLILLAFFTIGSSATFIAYTRKRKIGTAQKRRGARGYQNVLANGLTPTLLAVAFYLVGGEITLAAFCASLAGATADTLESEIGVLSPSPPRLITDFCEVPPGTDGGVSLLGAIAGIIGALIIALLSLVFSLIPLEMLIPVSLSGFLATIIESFLGALFKTKGERAGHILNLINTTLAPLLVIIWG
ncbi:MAG: TIGR00297 family protein [Myxococcota bacterium]